MMVEENLVSPNSSVASLLDKWPQVVPVFLHHHMSCVGCSMSIFETLADAARIYQVDLAELMQEIQRTLAEPVDNLPAEGEKISKEMIMSQPYLYFPQISEAIETIPSESIVSRTIYRDDKIKAIVFAFAPGQELSEHTASVPAMIQILEGECELTLGEDTYNAQAGAWARMPAKLKHSIVAKTPLKMLLLMLD